MILQNFCKILLFILRVTRTDSYISDEIYLKLLYRRCLNEKLNLDNPRTYNEKLQWLKLYNRRPEYTTMVDKLAVKEYVAKIIGEEYIIPTLGVWDKPEDIDWERLPDQFVLKCTHDSGGLIICRDKKQLDKKAAINKLKSCLERNYFRAGREWAYKNVPPRIIAEKYLCSDTIVDDLPDYKVFCFNGEPKLIELDYNRFSNHMRNMYNTNWEKVSMKISYSSDERRVFEKPEKLGEIMDLSRCLSKIMPFVRCDFYMVDSTIYFGELTLYPDAGFVNFQPKEWDDILGEWIKLPKRL